MLTNENFYANTRGDYAHSKFHISAHNTQHMSTTIGNEYLITGNLSIKELGLFKELINT